MNWIDWRADGNLLACCGVGKYIKVFDIREKNLVKTIGGFTGKLLQ